MIPIIIRSIPKVWRRVIFSLRKTKARSVAITVSPINMMEVALVERILIA